MDRAQIDRIRKLLVSDENWKLLDKDLINRIENNFYEPEYFSIQSLYMIHRNSENRLKFNLMIDTLYNTSQNYYNLYLKTDNENVNNVGYEKLKIYLLDELDYYISMKFKHQNNRYQLIRLKNLFDEILQLL